MLSDLRIERVGCSRVDAVDFEHLGFGDCFSDHMFSMVWEDGAWRRPEIVPYGPIAVEPANATLHYGQAVFEGLKAFRGVDGRVRIFRPDRNARRLARSCERLCIPELPEALLLAAIEELVRLDQAWVPGRRGEALYIRPLVFSTEGQLEVRPSRSYRLLIMTAPVRAYFDPSVSAVSLKVEEDYTRAAPGGTGYVKTAGNYAASLYPGERARAAGCAQVLWLDGVEHRFVEEVGAMNIFFRIAGRVVTPELRGTILPGVTRESVLTLLAERDEPVEERRISIEEVIEAIRTGTLEEAFGAGTAAIISPVGELVWRDERHLVNRGEAGELTRALYDTLTAIQLGEIEDRHGWNRIVEL